MLLQAVCNKNEMLMNNTEIHALLMKALNDIKTIELNDPEIEILNDNGKLLLNQLLAA